MKKSRIFVAVGIAFFSVRTIEHCWRKGTEFIKDYNLRQQIRFQANTFLSDDITNLNQLYLFSHVARATPEHNSLRAFLTAIRKPRPNENDQKNILEQPGPGASRTILHNWISASTQIWDKLRFEANDKSCWRAATVTLLHEIY